MNASDERALLSGNRDTPVEIQQRPATDAVDGSGFPSEDANTWTTLQEVEWMHKASVGGQERFASLQTSAPVDTRWVMTYRADMDPDLLDIAKVRRLVYLGRRYDIVTGVVIGRHHGIALTTLSRIG
jgi:hypothetical protein